MQREVKAGLLGLALTSLLLVVVFAARTGHATGDATVTERSIPRAVEETVITLLTVTYGLFLVAVLILAFRYRQSWRQPKSNWLSSFVAVFTIMCLIVVGYWLVSRRPANDAQKISPATRHLREPELHRRSKIPPRQADFNWPLAIGVVVLVLAGGTVLYLRLRKPPPTQPGASVQEDLAEVLDTTIEDLRRERDARRAVIAAYANMERVLAAHGFERRRAETPAEYLARILRALDVRERAVRTLTRLFEYAKFSAHEIDARMKEEAIDALVAIRDDLSREEALAA